VLRGGNSSSFCSVESLLRLDHNYLFHPGKFSFQPVLQALNQGHPRDVSAPAVSSRGYLDRSSLDAGQPHIAALVLIPLIHCCDDGFDLLDVLKIIQSFSFACCLSQHPYRQNGYSL
jgi:hypothetical protein